MSHSEDLMDGVEALEYVNDLLGREFVGSDRAVWNTIREDSTRVLYYLYRRFAGYEDEYTAGEFLEFWRSSSEEKRAAFLLDTLIDMREKGEFTRPEVITLAYMDREIP
jgi:hypothetical protein